MKNGRARRSRGNFVEADDAVLRVRADDPAFFAIERERFPFEKIENVGGGRELRGKLRAFLDAPADLERGDEAAGAAQRQPERGEVGNVPARKLKKRSRRRFQHFARVVLRRSFQPRAGVEQRGEKFVVAKTTRPAAHEAIAGTQCFAWSGCGQCGRERFILPRRREARRASFPRERRRPSSR